MKQLVKTAGPYLSRNRLARDIFFLTAEQFTPSLTSAVGPYRYYVSTSDRTVGREVFLTGGFDASCIQHIFDLLCALGLAKFNEKLFLDIGANIGTTTIPVVSEHGFAGGIAVEPEPANFRLLCASVDANAMQHRVRCVHAALSDTVGESEMELCPVNLGDHRLRPRSAVKADGIYHEVNRAVVTVPTTTFDRLVESHGINLSSLGLVWIDTQGHEGHVFNGARTLLKTSIPVVVEYWPYALRRAGGLELLEELLTENYTSFVDARVTETLTSEAIRPIGDILDLKAKYIGPDLTDLILIK